MAEDYSNYPFFKWVPKPIGIIFMIVLFVPMISMSGVYSANSGEMIGGLGIQSEYIVFAGFCTSIGMAAFSPFFYQLVCIRREKMMLLMGFAILFVLSNICAQTDSLFVLGLCSLLMGFVRQTLMMAHLFVFIRYAFGIEATKNITPGNEPQPEEDKRELVTTSKADERKLKAILKKIQDGTPEETVRKYFRFDEKADFLVNTALQDVMRS